MIERTALIADIHGNTPALRAVLEDVRAVGCTRLFMLGDIINGLDPAGCIDLLRAAWPDAAGIKGNAEHYLLTPRLDAFPLREDPAYAEHIEHILWWRAQLTSAQLEWLTALPDVITWGRACMVHDSPLDRMFPERWHRPEVEPIYQELYFHSKGIHPDLSDDLLGQLTSWMGSAGVEIFFCGHTHVPFYREAAGRAICNVGSVGMPLDGNPDAAWALVEDGPGGTRQVTIRRVAYDIGQILALLAQIDYPSMDQPHRRESYATMLTTGIHWRVHYNAARARQPPA
jgi:predicted phosphodiesterase